jgi:hypothetical protein
MNKRIFGLLLFLLLIGFVSARANYYNFGSEDDVSYKEKISKTYYDKDDDYTITRTIYAYYENDDRPSTYSYRHGYSYRDTTDYWERRYDFDVEDVEIRDYYEDTYERRYYDDYDKGRYDYYWIDYDDYGGNRLQYKYYPYIGRGVERNCYDYVPKDKLFYISCNDWLY